MNKLGLILLLFLISCKTDKKPTTTATSFPQAKYDWLIGFWEQEEGENFESWKKISASGYQGISYSNKNGDLKVTEYMRLYFLNNQWIFTAKVIGRNDGKEIEFDQYKKDERTKLAVQNMNHDFPRRIQYHLENDSLIRITLNENLKGEVKFRLKKATESKYEALIE